MKLLDAVNLVLPKLGERPVTSLTVKHPTLSILLPIIEDNLGDFLLRGWWFNKYDYTAYPAEDGTITLGTDALSFVPSQGYEAVMRGPKLFKPSTMSYAFDAPVKGILTQYVDFELCPESAASYVFNAACVEAYVTDIGMGAEVQVWQTSAGSAWNTLVAEHLRQSKTSTRQRRAWRYLERARNI